MYIYSNTVCTLNRTTTLLSLRCPLCNSTNIPPQRSRLSFVLTHRSSSGLTGLLSSVTHWWFAALIKLLDSWRGLVTQYTVHPHHHHTGESRLCVWYSCIHHQQLDVCMYVCIVKAFYSSYVNISPTVLFTGSGDKRDFFFFFFFPLSQYPFNVEEKKLHILLQMGCEIYRIVFSDIWD